VQPTRWALVLEAVRDLMASAEEQRSVLPMRSRERVFLLGVEAAALEVVHPELGVSRAVGWLDRQPHAFREGYLRTSAAIAAAATANPTPRRLTVPSPASR